MANERPQRNKQVNKSTLSPIKATGIVVFTVSVFVLLCLVTGGRLFGFIGKEIFYFVLASMGLFSYAFFAALSVSGLMIAAERRLEAPLRRILSVSAALLFLMLLLQLATTSAVIKEAESFGGYISAIYRSGLEGLSGANAGGVVFGTLLYPLQALLGNVGCYIIFGVLFAVAVYLALDIKAVAVKRSERPVGGRKIDGVISYDVNAHKDSGRGNPPSSPLQIIDFSPKSAQPTKSGGYDLLIPGEHTRVQPIGGGVDDRQPLPVATPAVEEAPKGGKPSARDILFHGGDPKSLENVTYVDDFAGRTKRDSIYGEQSVISESSSVVPVISAEPELDFTPSAGILTDSDYHPAEDDADERTFVHDDTGSIYAPPTQPIMPVAPVAPVATPHYSGVRRSGKNPIIDQIPMSIGQDAIVPAGEERLTPEEKARRERIERAKREGYILDTVSFEEDQGDRAPIISGDRYAEKKSSGKPKPEQRKEPEPIPEKEPELSFEEQELKRLGEIIVGYEDGRPITLLEKQNRDRLAAKNGERPEKKQPEREEVKKEEPKAVTPAPVEVEEEEPQAPIISNSTYLRQKQAEAPAPVKERELPSEPQPEAKKPAEPQPEIMKAQPEEEIQPPIIRLPVVEEQQEQEEEQAPILGIGADDSDVPVQLPEDEEEPEIPEKPVNPPFRSALPSFGSSLDTPEDEDEPAVGFPYAEGEKPLYDEPIIMDEPEEDEPPFDTEDESPFDVEEEPAPAPVAPVVPVAPVAPATPAVSAAPATTVASTDVEEEQAEEEPSYKRRHIVLEYTAPDLDMLADPKPSDYDWESECATVRDKLLGLFESRNIEADIVKISHGPTVTRYEIRFPIDIGMERVKALRSNFEMLMLGSVRIEMPIAGTDLFGIEAANRQREMVTFKEVAMTDAFLQSNSPTVFILGRDVAGENIVMDLADCPHLLIAGATGSGKSVCVNCILSSFLFHSSPNDLKLILIDPKQVEFASYRGLPHLLIDEIITTYERALAAFRWLVKEMERRYSLFAEKKVKNLKAYNRAINPEEEPPLYRIVLVVDEYADLVEASAKQREAIESAIKRLSAKARAAGIHLIIATQRPSVKVITGDIKSNLPSRIAFRVSSGADAQTVGFYGAENLLGRGDMLYQTPEMPDPKRVQSAYIDDKEMDMIVDYVKANCEVEYDDEIMMEMFAEAEPEIVESNEQVAMEGLVAAESENDKMLPRILKLGIERKQLSIAMVQRYFGMGYGRAGKLIDKLDKLGYISGFDGAKARQVYITMEQFREIYGDIDE
ncbi:MAG: DUF87 domain-containing protein [Clostridia bacterium]|nr:DUF87 domain-containing protein [Clostridia bacterium]